MRKLSELKNRASWSWGHSWPRQDRLQVMFIGVYHVLEDTVVHLILGMYQHLCIFLLPYPELGGLLKFVRPFLISISKAKAARLVRSLLDLFLDMEAATGQEVELCLECIEWAKAEKRTFLRQALEVNWNKNNLPVTRFIPNC